MGRAIVCFLFALVLFVAPGCTATETKVQVPESSATLKTLYYEEVITQFMDAGFTNVTAVATEVDGAGSVVEGSIVTISVEETVAFEADATFHPDAPVLVYYRVIKQPEPARVTEEMVWIPRTGEKYHRNASCSNMKNPTQTTMEQAKQLGYTACKRCY